MGSADSPNRGLQLRNGFACVPPLPISFGKHQPHFSLRDLKFPLDPPGARPLRVLDNRHDFTSSIVRACEKTWRSVTDWDGAEEMCCVWEVESASPSLAFLMYFGHDLLPGVYQCLGPFRAACVNLKLKNTSECQHLLRFGID